MRLLRNNNAFNYADLFIAADSHGIALPDVEEIKRDLKSGDLKILKAEKYVVFFVVVKTMLGDEILEVVSITNFSGNFFDIFDNVSIYAKENGFVALQINTELTALYKIAVKKKWLVESITMRKTF